jgi:hypothetical protein
MKDFGDPSWKRAMQYSLPLTGEKLPPGWVQVMGGPGMTDGMWDNHKRLLRVGASIALYGDDRVWLHLSISHRRRMPTYDELTYLKRHWAGEDRKCIMVFAPKDEHVNIHPRCLHLYCCLEGDPLPDFSTVILGKRSI